MKRQDEKPTIERLARAGPQPRVANMLAAVQGLQGNTLVAGKTTALRVFGGAGVVASAANLEATVLRPDGSRRLFSWTSDSFVTIPNGSAGPSIVVTVPGTELPWNGVYYFRLRIKDANGVELLAVALDNVPFLPTKDLRIMVSRIWSGTSDKPGELVAADTAMRRMSWIYPVRDGVGSLDGQPDAGLRYNVYDRPMGPPSQDGHLCPLFARWSNRPAPDDSIDTAITYRFPNGGEGSGGNSGHQCPGQTVLFSVIVWGAPLANVFCQETAHAFGLEAPQSPHLDPNFDAHHSKDVAIDLLDAELGFNTQFDAPWPVPTYDVMYPTGPDPEYPDPAHSLNSWDWEYLRQQLVKLPSTGPTATFISWTSLAGNQLRSFPCIGRNADGRQEVFVLGSDHSLYHIWETAPGAAWSAWSSLQGHDLQDLCLIANETDGSLAAFALGGDGSIYHRRQVAPNGGWADWTGLGGNQVKDFAVAQNADGHLEVVAIFSDGALYDIRQAGPNGRWGGWFPLLGHDLQGSVCLARNADGRLEVFAVGGDGVVYHIWQQGPNGQGGWSGWANLADPSLPAIASLAAISTSDGRLYAFLMRSDGAVSYRAQVAPNGGWAAPIHLFGHNLRWPCALGINPDGRLEIFVIGGDNQLYNRWQVDPTQPDVWSDWVNLGGRDLHAGLGAGADYRGELILYVVGGDGQLYRGPR